MVLSAVNPFVLVYFSAFVVIPIILYAVFCYKKFVVSEQLETVENFNSESYIKTVAVVKSRNRLFRKSKLCYTVDRQEFSITVPYYLESDSTVIYNKDYPDNAVLYDCELLKKTVRKYSTLANLSIILEFVMIVLTIMMFILIAKGAGSR